MIVLIYFLISLAGGIIPAFIAKQANKNFILWWIYGAIFLPIAIIHAILLLIKLEKGIIVVRILLVIYGIFIFYFVTWSFSTQPGALKWFEIGMNKYNLGKTLYEHTDNVTALTSNIIDYMIKKTEFDWDILKKAFSDFDNEKIKEKAYLLEFAINKTREIDEKVKESIWTQQDAGRIKEIMQIYSNSTDDILSTQFISVQDYMDEITEIDRSIIDDEFAYFEGEKHVDKEYVQTFALDLIKALENVYQITINKGAYEEWSVPMGEARKIFHLYLKSLKDLNIYLKESPTALEANYRAYLNAESTYFKETTIVDEYIQHLDKENSRDNDNERNLEIIDQYTYIGDTLVITDQLNLAYNCYDKAIALYRDILSREGTSAIEKARDLHSIGELYDKKSDIETLVDVFNDFLSVFFPERLFFDEDALYDLEAFIRLDTILKKKPNLTRIIKEFTDYIDNFPTDEKMQLYTVENKILKTFFPDMSRAARADFAPILKENYDYLISPMNLTIFPLIKEAYEFLDKFNFDDVAQTYVEMLVDVEPIVFSAVDTVKNETSIAFLEEIGKAQGYVEGIFLSDSLLDNKTSEDIKELQKGIREDSKKVIDTVIQIKDTMAIMDELMKHMEKEKNIKQKLEKDIEMKKIQMDKVQSDVSRATKEFNDIVKDIFRENKIITEEYDALLVQISEAQDIGERLGLVPPGQRKTMKEDMKKARAEVRNEVVSLSTIIDNIVEVKNKVAKKYDTVANSEQLLSIKEKIVLLNQEIDDMFFKYFPEELEAEKEESEKEK